MNHVTHLTYSAPSKDWSFSTKAKYAKLRTPRGLRTSFRKSFPFRPRMRPQAKVSPLERTRRARPSRWPVADVGARQPLQRAFTALAVRRKEHPLSDGNLHEVYHNWRRRAIRLSYNSPRRSTLIPIFFGTAYPDFPSDPNKCWVKSIFGPCGKLLGLSARRAETARKARFPRYSETGRTAPPPRIRPVNTERVEIVFQGWRAKYPHPRHEASHRREMRFHRVIILTMPKLRVRQGKPGHNEISPRNNLA